jgi:hypothetical protein
MATSWSQNEAARKSDESLEKMRERRREEEQQAKAMERSAKMNLSMSIAGNASSIIAEIIKLENLIADRETGQPDPTWRVSLKEQELLEDIDKLEDYYASQRIMMRETCERRCAEVYKKRDLDIEKIEKKARDEEERLRTTLEVALENRLLEEKPTIEKRKAKLAALDTRKEKMLDNQKIPVSLKKMKRELSELIDKYPRVSTEWVSQGYKLAELNSMFNIPTDYKKHQQYLNYQKKKGEATDVQNLKNESQKVFRDSQTENEMLGGGVGKKETTPPYENEITQQPANSSVKPKNTFTEIIPGKKFLEYSPKERENMDHGSYHDVWTVYQEELQVERETKERLMKAKLSKEDDEAEADQLRDERIEQEWKEIIMDQDLEYQIKKNWEVIKTEDMERLYNEYEPRTEAR